MINAQGKDSRWNEIPATKLATCKKRSGHFSLNKVSRHSNKVRKAIPESIPRHDRYNIPNQNAKWTKENDLTTNQ